MLTDADLAAARWAREHGDAAGRFTDTLTSAHWWFLPGVTEDRCDALVGASFAAEAAGIPPGRLRLAEAIAQQLAFAIERIRLAADLERGACRVKRNGCCRAAGSLSWSPWRPPAL